MCKENYEKYEKKYYTKRLDFLNIKNKIGSNQDLNNYWLYLSKVLLSLLRKLSFKVFLVL